MAEFLAIEIADLIAAGLAFTTTARRIPVREDSGRFLKSVNGAVYASALGLAIIGKFGDPQRALDRWTSAVRSTIEDEEFTVASSILGIPLALARLVEVNHRGGVAAAEIAVALRLGNLMVPPRRQAAPRRKVFCLYAKTG